MPSSGSDVYVLCQPCRLSKAASSHLTDEDLEVYAFVQGHTAHSEPVWTASQVIGKMV